MNTNTNVTALQWHNNTFTEERENSQDEVQSIIILYKIPKPINADTGILCTNIPIKIQMG